MGRATSSSSRRTGADLTELRHQIAVIKWSQQPDIRSKYPALKYLYHIGNERQCSPQYGKLLKLAGVKPGVPDLFLMTARGGYNGLYIEMKDMNGTADPDQRWWIEAANEEGYFARVCNGYESAVMLLEWYLNLSKVERPDRSLQPEPPRM